MIHIYLAEWEVWKHLRGTTSRPSFGKLEVEGEVPTS